MSLDSLSAKVKRLFYDAELLSQKVTMQAGAIWKLAERVKALEENAAKEREARAKGAGR